MTTTSYSVDITRQRSGTTAECEGCDQLHPDSTRERVRRHVKLTGHKARVIVEDSTVYVRRPA